MLLVTLNAAIGAALFAQSSTADLAAPPRLYGQDPTAPQCVCTDEAPTDFIKLEGLVIDAEVTLASNGRSTNDRQATIFDVAHASKDDVKGRTKVWHSTLVGQCGVTFDYGRRYTLAARKSETGELETNECLMRKLKATEDASN